MEEAWFQSLGWEEPLEKGLATHSSVLAWRIPWPEEPLVHKDLDTTEQLTLYTFKLNWNTRKSPGCENADS